MNLFGLFRKREGGSLSPKGYLSTGEWNLWRHLLEGTMPKGLLVAPMVPLAYLVEIRGRPSRELEELLGEAIPFLVVDGRGYPARAYLHPDQEELREALKGLGIPVEALPSEPPPEETREPADCPPRDNGRESTPQEPLEDPAGRIAQLFWQGELSETHLLPAKAQGEPPACPLCGAPMVLRKAKRGKRKGEAFWGCSRYPGCNGTRPVEK